MILLFVLAGLLGSCSAQYYVTCQCALYTPDQFNSTLVGNPVPLDYTASAEVATDDNCNRDPNLSNDCMVYCQTYYDQADTVDLCQSTASTTPRCTGSLWCEILYNSGIKNIDNGVVNLYYRMPECEGTAFTSWNYGWREIRDKNLCCENGLFSSCSSPCETCVELNLCECGVFADEQFDIESLDGANPLPLQYVAAEIGPPIEPYCTNWPSPEFGHPCDAQCRDAGDFYKSNVTLNSPSFRNPSVSYGQFYCQALRGRWADLWPEAGIGPTTLVTYGRMPGCNVDETNRHLRWQRQRPYSCHHERLCCDGNGDRFPCPILDEY